MVTVRIPRSLHEALRVEAHEHRTSMNKLCISKLLQFIDDGWSPAETSGMPPRRWRKKSRAGREWTYKPGSVPGGRPKPPRRAMAISLGGRLLGPSSSLPGSHCGPDQPAGVPAATKCGRTPVLPV